MKEGAEGIAREVFSGSDIHISYYRRPSLSGWCHRNTYWYLGIYILVSTYRYLGGVIGTHRNIGGVMGGDFKQYQLQQKMPKWFLDIQNLSAYCY